MNWRVLILLSILFLLCYQNTFNVPFHFDDRPNITQNSRIQINSLHPETLYKVALEEGFSNHRLFNRPASNLSLAVNWYFGQTDVTGYHIFNLSVHIFTAFFLYLTILALFRTPNLAGRYTDSEHFIALLATVLWASNPIQTQAVTYIVQRMASMAALFYVMGVYLYIMARVSRLTKHRVLFYAGVFLAFLLAVGSKENALMLPAALFLVEMVFFRDLSKPGTKKRFLLAGCFLLAGIFAAGVLLFMSNGLMASLQDRYADRSFTLFERLLTQPRVVIFYISQIFYPIADRLSIDNDIAVSTGIFQPWTTLPAILAILGAVAAAFRLMIRYPLVSFAVLFFFLNHVIESSIVPLEMVFEHRNYLPSLFLFVPVAAGVKWAIDYYQREKRSMAAVIIAFVTILVTLLGTGTYVRNMAWTSERALWQDAKEKSPGRARPYTNLGQGYYAKIGDYDKALELYKTAMHLNHDKHPDKVKLLSLKNIAKTYIARDRDYDEAIKTLNRATEIDPENLNAHFDLYISLIHAGRLEEAMEKSDYLLSEQPERVDFLNTRALLHLRKNQPNKAIPFLIKAIQKAPNNEHTLISLGQAKSMTGNHVAAEKFLGRIPKRSPRKTAALLLQIENSLRAGNEMDAEKYAEKLLNHKNPQTIREKLQEAQEPGPMWPVSADLVAPVIAEALKKQSTSIENLQTSDEG
ncbi:MAG: tetratricopeptide repeat protein [Desulfobacterales bacterium]